MTERCVKIKVLPQITEISKGLNCIIGTSRYAIVDNLNVGEKKVHELEIGEVISFKYKHYGRYYDLKCSILNNSIEDVIPGTINEDISSTFNESKKRIITSSLTEDVNVKKKSLKPFNINTESGRILESSDIGESNQNSDICNINQINNQEVSSSSSRIVINETINSQNSITTSSNDISCDEMFRLASLKTFPKKIVIVDEEKVNYTSTLNFFNFTDNFNTKPNKSLQFECKFCKKSLKSRLGKTTNLNKHLKTHDEMTNWYNEYQISQNIYEEKQIDDNTLLLIKYFISSNSALSSLKNKWLRELLADKVELIGPVAFRNSILPAIYLKLRNEIELRLQTAKTICLITDIWTNKQNTDFIGLGAEITTENFERELLIINMLPMKGRSHNAENIKAAIEEMVI